MMELKVWELIEKLQEFNQNVPIYVEHQNFEICWGGGDGCGKTNCQYVTLQITDNKEHTCES